MTKKRSIDDTLSLLGYSDYNVREALLDIFHILDAHEFDDATREQVLRVGIEIVSQNEASKIPDNPKWVPFELGTHRPGDVVRVKKEGYVGKAAWHLGKVGTVAAIRSGRVIVQYVGRSDGLGHYHHTDMIEVLKNG